jgi:hypothetical protein
MSNVGDALSGGGSDASGVTDSTFSDASLGDQIAGGSGSFTDSAGNASDAGGGGFNSFNNIASLFSGGGGGGGASPTAAAMSPASAPPAAGGDPTGASGGTQSNTTPGSTPNQNQQQQTGGGQKNQDPNYAPPQAVDQLKALLKQLNTGKPAGPTGIVPQGGQNAPFALPTLAAGQTGPQSPMQSSTNVLRNAAAQLAGSSPASASLPPLSAGETGSQSPQADIPASANLPGNELQFDPQTGTYSLPPGGVSTDAQGNPVTAAGTPAADTPLPPTRPGAQPAQADGGGRDVTVKPKGGGEETADLPTRVPPGSAKLPTKKPGASPAPDQPPPIPQPSRIIQDISGVSTGSPTALADLAQAARVILPLVGMFMGGGRRGGGGHFHGGRFTHGGGFGGGRGFAGGMRAMGGGLHGGRHPAAPGGWPYHHPQMGWHMHGGHPGPPWRPLHPNDAQAMVGGGMVGGQGQPGQQDPNAPDPNKPPQETHGGAGGQPDDAFQKSGFSANPFIDALVGQESRGGQNIVSDIDTDSRGLTRAQGGNPNEISQGYFQIQNHPGGTWDTYGRQAGIDLNKYPSPRSAPLDVQWQVAQRIPIGQWGPATKAILRQKFGNFDPNMPFGQVAAQYGPAGGRLAAQTPSTKQPPWAKRAPSVAAIPAAVPVTSQPMVAGG